MTVPDEAVEAAHGAIIGGTEETGPDFVFDFLDKAQIRALLTAAAPFIAAQAWDAGWNAGMRFESPKNPYRSEQ